MCDSASTVGAAVWGRACGRPRHCCIISLDGGPRRAREGEVLGVFVPYFHSGKCHWVAGGGMFPIRMRKLPNISVRQTCRSKVRFVGSLTIYSLSRSTLGFTKN